MGKWRRKRGKRARGGGRSQQTSPRGPGGMAGGKIGKKGLGTRHTQGPGEELGPPHGGLGEECEMLEKAALD